MTGVKVLLYGVANGKLGQVVGHTLISECDLARLEGLRIGRANGIKAPGYACIRTTVDGRQVIELLHRFLLNAATGMVVDHINHDTLDNRRENIRIATGAENQANRKLGRNNTTGYKGVVKLKGSTSYVAQTYIQRKRKYLGTYACPIRAAEAYDRFMLQRFGVFALLNFPQGAS